MEVGAEDASAGLLEALQRVGTRMPESVARAGGYERDAGTDRAEEGGPAAAVRAVVRHDERFRGDGRRAREERNLAAGLEIAR